MGNHKRKNTTYFISKVCVLATRAEIATTNLDTYLESLKTCVCGKQFRGISQKFCSHSCSSSHTNVSRGPRTEETKNNISSGLREYYSSVPKKSEPKKITTKKKKSTPVNKPASVGKPKGRTRIYMGEYCKLYKSKCPHCAAVWFSNTLNKICNDCRPLVGDLKHRFKFKFNVYDHPDLFDLAELNRVGFYSPGGKAGSWNPNGLSRDHKVSVSEAIRNSYDPFYITHQLNCQLMPHAENNRKNGESSIKYTDLVLLVDAYESNLIGALDRS